MTTATPDRIIKLAAERSVLYRLAGAGEPNAGLRRRTVEVTQEIEALWNVRRAEKAGKTEGFDLLVDRIYTSLRGEDYLDALKPPKVEEPGRQTVSFAA